MKKIYALLAFALLGATTFAQRALDIELRLTTPVDGSTVPQSNAQQIVFDFENVGDDLVEDDIIIFYIANYTTGEFYNFGGENLNDSGVLVDAIQVNSQTVGLVNTMVINSNILNGGTPFTFNTNAAGFNVGDNIMVIAEIYETASSNPGDEDQGAMGNNFGEFYLSAPVSAVANAKNTFFKAFPVPAIDQLTVVADEEVASIAIISLDGKVVSTVAGNKADVSKLTSGVYMYEATTVSGLKTVSKFVKK